LYFTIINGKIIKNMTVLEISRKMDRVNFIDQLSGSNPHIWEIWQNLTTRRFQSAVFIQLTEQKSYVNTRHKHHN